MVKQVSYSQKVIQSLRDYIERECPNPKVEYLKTEDGRTLDITEVLSEIEQRTQLGSELYVAWARLMEARGITT